MSLCNPVFSPIGLTFLHIRAPGSFCPPGTFYQDVLVESSCAGCPAGRFGTGFGMSSSAVTCTGVCPSGKYGAVTGLSASISCVNCPAGSFGSATGMSSSACQGKCPMGMYSTATGQTDSSSCLACPIATYGATTGSSACNLCAMGATTTTTGQTAATGCICDRPATYPGLTELQFRIKQLSFSGGCCDHFAIDDVNVTFSESGSCFYDGFDDAAATTANWVSISGGEATASNAGCGSKTGTSMFFNGDGTRQAISKSCRGMGVSSISLWVKLGDNGGPGTCEMVDAGEDVQIHYSTDGGTTWEFLQGFNTPGLYASVIVKAPSAGCAGCPAGTFGTVSGASSSASCTGACPAGTYSTAVGQTDSSSCTDLVCPHGKWSLRTGASSTTACSVWQPGPATLYGSGANVYGLLGTGDTLQRSTATLASLSFAVEFATMSSAGSGHTILLSSGATARALFTVSLFAPLPV